MIWAWLKRAFLPQREDFPPPGNVSTIMGVDTPAVQWCNDLIDQVYQNLPKRLRLTALANIHACEFIHDQRNLYTYGCYAFETHQIYLNASLLQACHNPAIYGPKTSQAKLREHIKYLLIHEGAHAIGEDHEHIDAKIKSGEYPIKF